MRCGRENCRHELDQHDAQDPGACLVKHCPCNGFVNPDEQKFNARVRRHHIEGSGEPSVRVGAPPALSGFSPLAEDARGSVGSDDPIDGAGERIPVHKEFAAPFEHLNFVPSVLTVDLAFILEKDQEYNASWLSRGGVGAFMMLARKWDRLEPMVKRYGYDVFAMLNAHPDRIDDIQDLRRYLTLVDAEWQRRNAPKRA